MASRVSKKRLSAPAALIAVLAAASISIFLAAAPQQDPGGLASAAKQPGAHDVGEAVVLARDPRIVLERGAVSMPRSGPFWAWFAQFTGSREHLVIEDATLSVDLAPGTALPGDGDGARAAMSSWRAALETASFESLSLRRATVLLRTDNGGVERLLDVNADIGARPRSAFKAKGTLTFRGETLSFGAALGPPDDKAPGGGRGVRLRVASALLNADISGRLMAGDGLKLAAGQAAAAAPRVRDAARWLGASWPDGPGLENFRVDGEFEWSGRAVSFQNAAIEMDGNRAKGNLTLSFEGARPSFDGTLAFDDLNLTPYLVPETGNGETARGAGETSSLAMWKSIDADIRISAERVTAHGEEFGRGAVTLSLENGRLLADMAELNLSSGGGGQGQISLDMTGPEPRYSLRGKLEALDAAAASQALLGCSLMQGRIGATLDLSAQGWSRDRFFSTLGGKLDIEAPDASWIAVDAEALASAARGEAMTGWDFARRGRTPIDWLLGRFTFEAGVATAQALMAGAGAKQLSAAGTIDLFARALDLRLTIGPRLGADQPGSSPGYVTLGIAGPWANPDFKPLPAEKAARPAALAPPM